MIKNKVFTNVTSIRIPIVASFLDFWKNNRRRYF